MYELMPNIRFQIGKGQLYIIADEICERKEESDRSQCSIYLSGFRIANLDEDGNLIEGNVLAFEDANAPKIARFLAMVLWDIAKGTVSLPIELEDYSLKIDSPNNFDIRISKGKEHVIVPGDNVSELGGKLMVIMGSIPYKSTVGISTMK
jgi:hypothetical protein